MRGRENTEVPRQVRRGRRTLGRGRVPTRQSDGHTQRVGVCVSKSHWATDTSDRPERVYKKRDFSQLSVDECINRNRETDQTEVYDFLSLI